MNKIKLVLAGIVIILFILPNLANASLDEYDIERSPWTEKEQPETLDDAVNEIKQMIKNNRPGWEIAKRAATIADNQIINKNDPERMGASWKHWFGDLFGESDEDRNFNNWRGAHPAGDEQYDVAAKWVWNSRYGQCEENAALLYYLLKEAGEEDIRIFTSARDKHQYVVWGLGCEKDPNKPESWTEDVIIPDSWQHKVIRRQAVLNNEDCAVGGGYEVSEQTYNRDKKACGFVGNKCCKKLPPCRGAPDRVCRDDDICYICGNRGQYCCKDEKCNEGLECVDDKCVKKSKEDEEEEVTPELSYNRCSIEIFCNIHYQFSNRVVERHYDRSMLWEMSGSFSGNRFTALETYAKEAEDDGQRGYEWKRTMDVTVDPTTHDVTSFSYTKTATNTDGGLRTTRISGNDIPKIGEFNNRLVCKVPGEDADDQISFTESLSVQGDWVWRVKDYKCKEITITFSHE